MNDVELGRDERISALMDGILDDHACQATIDALTDGSQAAKVWSAYHLIGDVLRSPELASRQPDFDFLARFEKNLAASHSALAGPYATGLLADPEFPTGSGPAPRAILQSANAAVFRWKLATSVASAAFVCVMGVGLWNRLAGDENQTLSSTAAPVAAAPVVTANGEQSDVIVRDARLDALMAAHRELGGHSALQMPAGFLRNATYAGPGR